MCIFSGAVSEVSTTRIFGRHLDGDRQVLVYSMNVTLDRELAMVLPVPVPPGSGDVSFVDLSRYPEFFDDVEMAFSAPLGGIRESASPMARGRSPLAVHDVGAFVASYVPSPADLDRLDPRFRIPQAVFAEQAYEDWGFAVFQLKPHAKSGGPLAIHPMALVFPTRRPRALFFPTLHVHDGVSVPLIAHHDHTLLCQSDDELLTRTFGWGASARPLGDHVDADRARGVIAPRTRAYQQELQGDLRNADQWFEPPRCAGPQVLSGRGDCFAFDLSALAAYTTEQPGDGDTPSDRARRVTAQTRLDELHAGMVAELTELTAARAADWGFGRLAGDAATVLELFENRPYRFENGGAIWFEPGAPGPFELAISASSERVEPQVVRFGFAAAPSPQIVEQLEVELARVLDRAVADH